MTTPDERQTHLKIYVRNETDCWPPSARRKAGHGIFRAYLYDSLLKGHCQEATLSYQLWPLYTSFYGDPENAQGLWLMEDNKPIFVYCWRLDSMAVGHFYDCGPDVIPEGTDYGEYFLARLEHFAQTRPLTIPAGTNIPTLTYVHESLYRDADEVTNECWMVRFKRNGMEGPLKAKLVSPSERDLGLLELERWIFQQCVKQQYDAAEICLAPPSQDAQWVR